MSKTQGSDWPSTFLYLADCQAATAEWFDSNNRPKHEARRHNSLCQTYLDRLEWMEKNEPLNEADRNKLPYVKTRLKAAIVALTNRHGAIPR